MERIIWDEDMIMYASDIAAIEFVKQSEFFSTFSDHSHTVVMPSKWGRENAKEWSVGGPKIEIPLLETRDGLAYGFVPRTTESLALFPNTPDAHYLANGRPLCIHERRSQIMVEGANMMCYRKGFVEVGVKFPYNAHPIPLAYGDTVCFISPKPHEFCDLIDH